LKGTLSHLLAAGHIWGHHRSCNHSRIIWSQLCDEPCIFWRGAQGSATHGLQVDGHRMGWT